MSKVLKYFDVILILIGAITAIYTQTSETQNIYVLIAGIVVFMFGMMRLSRRIPSKKQDDSFIKQDDE